MRLCKGSLPTRDCVITILTGLFICCSMKKSLDGFMHFSEDYKGFRGAPRLKVELVALWNSVP